MPSKLTHAQKTNQATFFGNLLKASGHTQITRDQLNQVHNDFKTKWVQERPSERCAGLSDLRYVLRTRRVLLKVGDSKDDFIVASGHAKGAAPVGGEEDENTQSLGPRHRRRRFKKNRLARLAVDQHVTNHHKERSAPPQDSVVNHRVGPQTHGLEACGKEIVCKLCKVSVLSEPEAVKHVNGRKHRVQTMLSCLKHDRSALIENKHDISISSAHLEPNGTIRAEIREGQSNVVTINVRNHSSRRSINFERCELMKRVRVFQLDDVKGVTDGLNSVCLKPCESYQVKLTMLASHIGAFHTAIAFAFTTDPPCEKDESEFLIVRYLCVKCTDPLVDLLQPQVPYTPPPRVSAKLIDVEVVDGFPVPRNKSEYLEREIRLDTYYVAPYLRSMVNHGMVVDEKGSEAYLAREELERGLMAENHGGRFDTLLKIEEIQMEVDIRKYDMVGVTMKCNKRLLVLKVPGLAENRPSVLRGDCLYVRIIGSSGKAEGCEYKGYVHEIGPDHVYLGFSQKLLDRYVKNTKFSVRYEFNRLPLRVQHRAVQLAAENSLDKMLFPTESTACSTGRVPAVNIRYFDQRIEANSEQKEAVRCIVEGSSRPAPYLIFGPPGTGKTVTMVEAIKQVVSRIGSSHALVCAPSNSAADLLTERLLAHLDKNSVCRLHAASRDWRAIPEKVKPCSNYNPNTKEFCYPNKAELCRFRVIVCTLITAGRLVSANFPVSHFTHVFVDEAGHAVEPEVLVPIAGVLECDHDPDGGLDPVLSGQVVLAGDPQQLGAVIRSPIAIKHGLGVSLLERLMTTCDVYRRREPTSTSVSITPYNPNILTKLVRNYRSHPAILHLPNKFFYHNELEVHADLAVRESLCRWKGLPAKGFPMLFHGTTAQEMREERSPSFFNPTEVSIVMRYVQELLAARGAGVRIKEKDIGIISPYRKQVQKIQSALKMKNISSEIKVGSVEEFQGQERLVMIISTVRTSPEYLTMDLEFKLGFLKNPKRFNVAITRAKALLIIIGNPYVLAKDEHWHAFLEYCQSKGAYKGVDYEPEAAQLEDIIQRFTSLKLDCPVVDGSVSMTELIEGPEWRRSDE